MKIAASNLATIDKVSAAVAHTARGVAGVSSAVAERLTGGRYIDYASGAPMRRAMA